MTDLLLAASFLLAVVLAAGASAGETGAFAAGRPVKFGCAYYPEAWEESRWPQDLADMKAIGLSVVRVGEFNWTGFEPTEGVFDFEPYRRFLALCEREGFEVVMCTPTATLPPWMTARYPDTERVEDGGRRVPFGSRQSRCPSSPKFRFFAERIARRMAEAFRDFRCIRCWQIDNELHMNAGFDTCSCTHCEAEFRAWLRRRYGSLDGLNRAWNHAFWSAHISDWSEIRLPISKRREAWRTELVRCQSDTYVAFALEQARTIRAVIPDARTTSNGSETSGRMRLDRLYRGLGTVAVDTYVDEGDRDRCKWMWALARGLSGRQAPFLVAEMGPFNWDMEVADADAEVGSWVEDAVAHGAECVLFFRWRQSVNGEQYHPAILPWSGRKGTAYRRVREIVARRPTVRMPSSDVAVWHSNASDQDTLVRFDKMQFGPYEDLSIRLNAELERRGILPDYVMEETEADLSGYRVIFVPLATIVSERDVARLRRYAEAGGTLVALARLNVLDPMGGSYYTEPYPVGMTDLFGLEIDEQRGFPWKDEVFDCVRPTTCTVKMTLEKSAFAGSPMLTENVRGAGRAWYCATVPKDKDLTRLLDAVLPNARNLPNHHLVHCNEQSFGSPPCVAE